MCAEIKNKSKEQNGDSSKNSLLAAIVSGVTVAIITAITNGFVTNWQVGRTLESWKEQFRIQKNWEQTQNIIEYKSELILYHDSAAARKSYINANLIEYHFYDTIAALSANQDDPSVVAMRNNQSVLLSENKTLNDLHDSDVRQYEHKIKYLAEFTSDTCPSDLIDLAKNQFSVSLNYRQVILKAMENAPNKVARPHEFLAYIKKNVFKDFISFDAEKAEFQSAVDDCFEIAEEK